MAADVSHCSGPSPQGMLILPNQRSEQRKPRPTHHSETKQNVSRTDTWPDTEHATATCSKPRPPAAGNTKPPKPTAPPEHPTGQDAQLQIPAYLYWEAQSCRDLLSKTVWGDKQHEQMRKHVCTLTHMQEHSMLLVSFCTSHSETSEVNLH